MGSPFLLSEKCGALLETQLLGSLGSISRRAKALLGRARAKVHWTLWHPSRALLDNKKDFRIGSPFLLSEKCEHFSKPNCLAVWVRFLGELKHSSVVPEPRSTGPCGTRLALSKITKGTYFTSPRRNSRVFCELCSQKTPRGMLPVNQWYLDNANNT